MTDRSLSRLSPDVNLAGEPKKAPPAIRFRHIALLLLGGSAAGCFIGLLIGLPVYGLTHSRFVAGSLAGIALYATLMVGYHWISQEQSWVDLRTRFASVGLRPLILSALTAMALIVLISVVVWMARWAGIKLAHDPSPIELQNWGQLPLAIFLIVIVAPACEELLFRGLLLDWLKEKMNVWIATAILSVIFSLLHGNHFSLGAIGWISFSARLLQGLAASAFAIKYRSLRPAFVLHATWNAIGVFSIAFDHAQQPTPHTPSALILL